MINIIKEAKTHKIDFGVKTPRIFCKAFEDNSGALEMATTPKMRPRTKYINVKYHHFRSFVEDGSIVIQSVKSKDQMADALTKLLPLRLFRKFRKEMMGW